MDLECSCFINKLILFPFTLHFRLFPVEGRLGQIVALFSSFFSPFSFFLIGSQKFESLWTIQMEDKEIVYPAVKKLQ